MRRLLFIAVASTFLLAGCTSTTTAAPTPSTSMPGEVPPSPTPEPSPTTDSEYGAFGSRENVITTCLALEKEHVGAPYLTVHADQARVEPRAVLPEWLVYIPAVNDNGDVAIYCILGGSPENIDFVTVGGTLPLSEEEIQRDIASNDRYTP